MIQETLQFCEVIVLCYNMQIGFQVTSHVLPPSTWHILEIIVYTLTIVVIVYILN
jgi:uncharacterized protein involved in response to NO